jgi:hypothetical protein
MKTAEMIGPDYDRRPDGRPPASPTGRPGFWARLTSEASGGGGYYSWTRLKADAATEYAPAQTGTDDAKEVNATEDLPVGAAGTGTVVWMEKDYTDDPAEWRFAYKAGVPPGDEDDEILVWDQTTDKAWEATTPTEITVVTAFQVTGVTLQVKTRTVKAVKAGTESAWTTVHTGTECP